MENQKSAFTASVMYGLLLGVALVVFGLLMYLLDIDHNSRIMWISYLITIAGLFWAMISFRDNYSGGFISYGKAFGVGFWTGLFAAIISAVFTYVYVSMIDPGLIDKILIEAEEKILESNPDIGDEELEMALSYTEKFTSPAMIAIWGFIANVIFNTIFSLIIAIFARREGTPEINEEELTEA